MEETEKPVAVCEAEMSDGMLFEVYGRIYRRLRTLGIFLSVLGLVSVALFFVFRDPFWVVYGAVMFVFGIVYSFAVLRIVTKKSVRTHKAVNGTRVREEFGRAAVTVIGERSTAIYEYKNMFRAVETKNVWLLYMGEKRAALVLFVPKGGFTEGSEAAFTALLGEILDEKSIRRQK